MIQPGKSPPSTASHIEPIHVEGELGGGAAFCQTFFKISGRAVCNSMVAKAPA